jgi:hypothetical protein
MPKDSWRYTEEGIAYYARIERSVDRLTARELREKAIQDHATDPHVEGHQIDAWLDGKHDLDDANG